MPATKVNINGIDELDLNLSGTTTATTAAGVTTINNTPAQQITLKTNGTNNGSQSILNLKNGTGISIADDGLGGITINGSATGVTSVTASSPLVSSGGTTPNISATLPGGMGVSIYGAVLPNTGFIGAIQMPYNCTITGWTIITNSSSGSAQFDVKKSTYAGYPTTTSIVASAPPVVSSSQKATSSTLTGWTTTVTAGDVVEFYLTSVSVTTILSLVVDVVRT